MGLLATAALVVLHQCRQTSRGDLVSALESVSNNSDSDSNHDGEEVDDADDACDGEHADQLYMYADVQDQTVPLTGGEHPHKNENQKVIKSKEKIEGIRIHKLSSMAINKMNMEDTDQAAAEVTAEEVDESAGTVRGTGSSRPFKKGKRKKSKAENKGSTPQEEREIII
jgi:hypothetical protein